MSRRLEEPALSVAWRLSCAWCEPPVADVEGLMRDLGWMSDNSAREHRSAHAFMVDVRRRVVTPLGG